MTSPRPATVLFVAGLGVTVEMLVTPLARVLTGGGIRCVVAVGRGTVGAALRRDFDHVYEITPFRRGGPGDFARAAWELRRIIRAERPTLLHLHTPYAVALGRMTARATRTPHIAVVHGTLFGASSKAGRLFSLVEGASAFLTGVYVTVNPEDQRTYRRIAPRSVVHLAACGGAGVDMARLSADRRDADADTADRPPRLLVMGRLTQDKNLDLAVAAWQRARHSVPDLELRVVGAAVAGEPEWTPPALPGLSTAGWTTRSGGELAAADVVLSTSTREGFGMVLAEALTVGTPVVAVENRGTRAIAEQVTEGITVVPASVSALSAAIVSRLRDRRVWIDPAVVRAWSRDAVVSFHVDRIIEVLDGSNAGKNEVKGRAS